MAEHEMWMQGESQAVEYKEHFDGKADRSRFMRTVVAFANGAGGKIVIGIEDDTGRVVGLPAEANLPQLMDAVVNAVMDQCAPMISLQVRLESYQGKNVLVTDVFPGNLTPYFVRRLGRTDGVFVRVGATTRPADDAVRRELEFRGTRRSLDAERSSRGGELTAERIDGLCDRLYREAAKNAASLAFSEPVLRPGLPQLKSWQLVTETDGRLWPTYGFELLEGTAEDMPGAVVRCGLFLGTSRVAIGDTKVFKGGLIEEFHQTMEWILSKLETRWVIEGGERYDVPELPPEAIRELVMNALCHRSYFAADEPVTVAFYRDRLEITSPGGLPASLSLAQVLKGHTVFRNAALANALLYCRLIERWGSGIPRAFAAMERWKLLPPEMEDMGTALRVVLRRPSADWDASRVLQPLKGEEPSALDKETTQEEAVLAAIRRKPKATLRELSDEIGINLTGRQIRYIEDKLKAAGRLERKGRGGGYWIVKD